MNESILTINTILLCTVNVFFMIAGTFLNVVVITSFGTSSQLRKKASHLMILVLSCFDLAVVTVTHPMIISSTVEVSQGKYSRAHVHDQVKRFIITCLYGWSMLALLTMTAERFLGITYPIFHRTSVTKKRLLYLLAFLWSSLNILLVLSFRDQVLSYNTLIIAYMAICLLLSLTLNVKMYIIAKTRLRNPIVPAGKESDGEKNNKNRLAKISTCCLAFACFCISSFPATLVTGLRSRRKIPDGEMYSLLFLWSITLTSMNSTFNCLIFFWKNAVLRCEGMKMVNRLRRSVNLSRAS